ncbi:adenylate kinase [Arcanobacterium haemolyticum]|uniref:Adenylate kinase n=1 Tax=Arcanobacterium haemolyticum (strain ATCC 9345 / DSM 20595 / CCM 5947 / CCUG 17215 / LMG 16163 / NBRC 15585 / NCTC 8452 / 11018) TaxID=644284 RepID=D7BK89_ARCHD|nr:adenylate kinase [Arcanobacterium haemolyticum]ADH93069.1 adenylate kinase [Arcanobacterium haemolyticum DSM 20595]QCX47133.1 adenylate kinase [Arcanobacterium haemolyticum]SPT75357.1 Adenylate kinase [Arcanobacterium haemolyticum]SQH28173.1 Adenylate kinase [Arcanobacterium haemolyticum]
MSFRLILAGPPGAGKGTQATTVSQQLGIPAISTGEIFRAEIANKSDIGLEAQRYISEGNLVPDSVTNEIVRRRLARPDAVNGFLLDGYPRTLEQIDALEAMLAEDGLSIDAMVDIEIPDEEVEGRLLKRAEIEGRADDTPEVIAHRVKVYHDATEPIIGAFRDRNKLITIDGMGTIEEVRERIVTAVKERLGLN